MSDAERINLMLMVKEGRMRTDDAVEAVSDVTRRADDYLKSEPT